MFSVNGIEITGMKRRKDLEVRYENLYFYEDKTGYIHIVKRDHRKTDDEIVDIYSIFEKGIIKKREDGYNMNDIMKSMGAIDCEFKRFISLRGIK